MMTTSSFKNFISGSKIFILFFFIYFLVFSFFTNAQSVTTLISDGDEAYTTGNFYAASVFYQKAYEKDSTDPEIAWKLAEAYLLDNNYPYAERYYIKVLNKSANRNYTLAYFRLGTAQKFLRKYTEAKKNFSLYYKTQYKNDDYYVKKALQEIESCDYAWKILADTLNANIENCGPVINSVHSELAPFRSSDSAFYFSSSRPRIVKINKKEKDSVLINHAGIYYSSIIDSSWGFLSAGDSIFNNIKYNNANLSISPDKKISLFSRCSIEPDKKHCELFIRKWNNNRWAKAERLDNKVNLAGFSSTQPSVSQDITGGYILYFVSDRPGGFGGYDIWSCTLLPDGKVTNPVNLGKVINTPDDEITPFYQSATQTLYFSSTWHKGLGGFDIFRSERKSLYWGEPQNIGYPLNTSYNDLYFTCNRFANTGYFTSNRPGSMHDSLKGSTCCSDIYSFKISEKKPVIVPKDTLPDSTHITPVSTTPALPLPTTEQGQNIILSEMKKLIPLSLYFHNDEPDPATLSPKSSKNFFDLANHYILMKDIYKIEYAKGLEGETKNTAESEIEDFFKYQVENSEKKLDRFLELLLSLLENGRKVEVTLKGYCSPLNSNEYNALLAKRRISSLINYIQTWNNSALLKYLETKTNNTKMLTLTEEPVGELKTSSVVSDDLKDLRNSVYSPAAAKERKIEVLMAEWGEE